LQTSIEGEMMAGFKRALHMRCNSVDALGVVSPRSTIYASSPSELLANEHR
jgi:hypothetical protein